MKLYDKLVDKAESLALVGLGYVGMTIAVTNWLTRRNLLLSLVLAMWV